LKHFVMLSSIMEDGTVPDPRRSPTPAELLPDPPAIRARLSDLAAEAELLRALLRLLERRECGRRLMRRRAADRREVERD
jgi:hypothetical protein